MKKIMLMLLLCSTFSQVRLFPDSIFDQVSWEQVSSKDDITLYMNNSRKIYFYKAETVLSRTEAGQLFQCLMQFENYNQIFSPKFNLKTIKSLGERKLLLYAVLDFSPLKIRDYFIELVYEETDEAYTIEWYPSPAQHTDNEQFLRVNDIYGRWKIKKMKDDRVLLSVEYHNDWKVFVSQDILSYFEKKNTVDAIYKIIEYSQSRKVN